MVDGDVFRISEAVDAAELAAARFDRKQTNKDRAAEELAKSAAAAAQRRAADAASDDDKERLPSLQIAEETDDAMARIFLGF